MKRVTIKLTAKQFKQLEELRAGRSEHFGLLGQAFIAPTLGWSVIGTADFYYMAPEQVAIINKAILRARKLGGEAK